MKRQQARLPGPGDAAFRGRGGLGLDFRLWGLWPGHPYPHRGAAALRANEAACEQNVRDYLATGDETYLQSGAIPYPGVSSFLERIRIPELQALLPVSVRPPLPLTLGAGQTSFIAHNSRPPSQADPYAASAANAPTGFPGTLAAAGQSHHLGILRRQAPPTPGRGPALRCPGGARLADVSDGRPGG